MSKDTLGRKRSPAQDEALRQINDAKRIPDGHSTRKHRITLPDDLHEQLAQMTPRERGELIKQELS